MAKSKQKTTGKRQQRRTLPTLIAIILCDRIISEATTRKSSLIGLFQRFIVRMPDRQVGPFCIFARMMGGKGKYKFGAEVVRPNGKSDLISEVEVNFSPGVMIDGWITVGKWKFSNTGHHKFFITLDGKRIGNPSLVDVVVSDSET